MSEAQVVVFELAGNRYALFITDVHEILRVTEISPLPEMPAHVEGVINLRGKVITVVNLRSRLGLPKVEIGPEARVILVKSGDRLFGLVVDRVLEVSTFTQQEMEQPDALGIEETMLHGIVKHTDSLWMVLDLKRIA